MQKTTPARSNGKHPVGRPSKYSPAYGPQMVAFFSRKPYTTLREVSSDTGTIKLVRQANDPLLLIDFALTIGVHLATLYDWAKVHPEFDEAFKTVRALQERYYVTCGALGLTNPSITGLILKTNHGYREREDPPAGEAAPGSRITFVVNVHGATHQVSPEPDALGSARR